MLKVTIYTRYPSVVAELIETDYKRIVTLEAAEMIKEVKILTEQVNLTEVKEENLEVLYDYTGKFSDDPLESWMRWAMNCGLIRTTKTEKV